MYCQFHTVERWADVIHDHGYVLFMQQWSTLLQQNSWFSNFLYTEIKSLEERTTF